MLKIGFDRIPTGCSTYVCLKFGQTYVEHLVVIESIWSPNTFKYKRPFGNFLICTERQFSKISFIYFSANGNYQIKKLRKGRQKRAACTVCFGILAGCGF